ncbi:hypothetical protein [Klebsiella pneumoniae]
MTDITELAQREKFEAWAEERCALPWGYLKNRRTNTGYFSKHDYTSLWAAWKAAGAELVEALEKAQETIAFQQREIKALLSSLESRTVTVKLPEGDERDDLVISITEEIAHLQRCVERYRKEEMASTTQEMEQRLLVQKIALSVLNSGAGIKWEAE